MHPPTHALLSWLVAESVPTLERRDRALVLVGGLFPDLDALSYLGGKECYLEWHRVVLHNGLSAFSFAIAAACLARRRVVTGVLALAMYHLHMLCDIVGSAGPDGSKWPVPYLVPFDMSSRIVVDWQWQLASWQNVTITVLALLACAHVAARRGRTILEPISKRADAAVVEVIRRRWPFARRTT